MIETVENEFYLILKFVNKVNYKKPILSQCIISKTSFRDFQIFTTYKCNKRLMKMMVMNIERAYKLFGDLGMQKKR